MRRVMIATPSDDGRCEVLYVHSLVESIRLCAARSIQLLPVFIPGDALIQRARNELLQIGLEANVDDLVFIDADQCWRAEDLLSLLNHPVDCVGGAYRKKSEREQYAVVSSLHPPVEMATKLLLVEALGTGFLRLSRKAMETLWQASEPYENEGKTCRMVFDVKVLDGRLVSEDVIMCLKLRAAGIAVHLDAAINVGHVGPKTYAGDFAAYLARLQASQQRTA